MKVFLKIGGIYFFLLGLTTILFYVFVGYKSVHIYQGTFIQTLEAVLIMVFMGLLLVLTGIGLFMLKKLALYVASIISIMGMFGTLKGTIHLNVIHGIEFVIFAAILLSSVFYLIQTKLKKL